MEELVKAEYFGVKPAELTQESVARIAAIFGLGLICRDTGSEGDVIYFLVEDEDFAIGGYKNLFEVLINAMFETQSHWNLGCNTYYFDPDLVLMLKELVEYDAYPELYRFVQRQISELERDGLARAITKEADDNGDIQPSVIAL